MPKILCLKTDEGGWANLPESIRNQWEVVSAASPMDAVRILSDKDVGGVYLSGLSDGVPDSSAIKLFQNCIMLDDMSDGVALLDRDNQIIQANKRLARWFGKRDLTGLNFYKAMGNPDIHGSEPSPLSTCWAVRKKCMATMFVNEKYYQLNVSPVLDENGDPVYLIATLRDSTEFTLKRQKLEALHEAGLALADLRPEEIFEMDVEQRIELMRDNILHYTKDLLDYDVVEVRLLDHETGQLEPLLSVGIESERSKQPLFPLPHDNGVTGFVVATGKSYLCEDAANDPLYLDGLIGARSSLTVPLKYHDEVIGSFNVESPEVGAFDESDVKFVELFARDIAQSLNTLELLVAQKTTAAQESVEAIHGAVALPVDEILNDTVHVIESYIGHNPDVVKRLRSILKNVRDIKQVIQKVGEKMAPAEALPAGVQVPQRPLLKNKTILVIDSDEQVRTSAHNLLERYGCTVETADQGHAAILMIRNSERDYDAIISDIRLPDLSGYELLLELKELTQEEDGRLILMTGFGYDPGHSIVKARKAGLRAGAVLYKPFRIDQLLEIVESFVSTPETAAN